MRRSTADLLSEAASLVSAGLWIDPENHEEIDQFLIVLREWSEKSEDQIAALRAFLVRVKSECDLLREEERRLAERRRSLERLQTPAKAEVRQLLEAAELATGEAKVKRPDFTAYLRAGQVVDAPEDLTRWPDRFVVTVKKADRAGVKKALKNGEEIAGFALREQRSVVFR